MFIAFDVFPTKIFCGIHKINTNHQISNIKYNMALNNSYVNKLSFIDHVLFYPNVGIRTCDWRSYDTMHFPLFQTHLLDIFPHLGKEVMYRWDKEANRWDINIDKCWMQIVFYPEPYPNEEFKPEPGAEDVKQILWIHFNFVDGPNKDIYYNTWRKLYMYFDSLPFKPELELFH
jgi:hypothetical protein